MLGESYSQRPSQHQSHYSQGPSKASTNATIPALCSPSPWLSTESCTSKHIPARAEVDTAATLRLRRYRIPVGIGPSILRFLLDTQSPHLLARRCCCDRLQNQLPSSPPTRSLDPYPPSPQRRAAVRPPAYQWRTVSQDWAGHCHAISHTPTRVPEDVLEDVR